MRRIIFTALFLSNLFFTYGQELSIVFSHLDEKNGLSDNIVNCFFKDSRGILWIGTYNGFNRFDGSNFYNYKKRKGPNSMLNEVVHSLCEDKKGNIWGSTDNGVFCYQPGSDMFSNYPIRSMGTGNNFYNITSDKNGDVWAAGDWSVFRFDNSKNSFDEVIKLTQYKDSLSFYKIRKNGLLIDPSGNGIWMATRLGLMYYDIQKNSIQNFKTNPDDSLFAPETVSALSKTASGNFWFFNNKQKNIVLFDPVSRKILQKINIRSSLPSADAGTLFEDKSKRLWFSSITYEMLVIDLANNNKVHKLEHKPDDQRTIGARFFWAVFQDDDGAIWLGTAGGISRCNPERNIYNHLRLPEKINELNETSIQVAEEDPFDKSFWLVTRSSFLIHYNPQNEKYEAYDLNKAETGNGELKPGPCNAISFFKDNIIITTATGAWQIKRNGRKISPFNFLPPGFENFRCTEIVFNGDSVIYFNDGKQLLYWNYLSGKAQLIAFKAEVPGKTTISGLTLTANHQLWMIASNNHIAFVDKEKKLTLVKIAKNESSETGIIASIDVDSSGKVWIFNRGAGLYCYNPDTKETRLWNETDGLIGNRIRTGKMDNTGKVWNVLYNKISVYIPLTNRFYNFKIPYSESNPNYYNHISKRSNGNIFCTINNEIVEFFPERLFATPAVRRPQISQLNAAGKDFQILFNDKIVLRPKENTVRLRFGITTDNEIFPYDLEYKLESAETNWTIASENHEALYNNLSSGDYTFRVRAKGKNNTWQSEETTFSFTIRTPFYKTTFFLILIALLTSSILFFIYRYRDSQKEKLMLLESKAQMLEKEKALVMYEGLKQQLNPHFLFNSLTSLNSLIIADPKAASEFLDSLSKTYRYILKSRDSETVSLGNEIKFAENYIRLQQTRFEKGFKVHINVPEEFYHREIVPVTLQNLIENAIKHNIIDEDRPLSVNIFTEDNFLVVQNNLQRKNFVETSNKQGLANLQSLYHYLSDRPVEIGEKNDLFIVKIPLL